MLNQQLRILLICLLLPAAAFSQSVDSTQLYYQYVNRPTQPAHLPSAYFYYLEAAHSHIKNGDTLHAIDALRLAAIASFKLGIVADSEQEAVQALQWLEVLSVDSHNKRDKNSRYAGLYNHLGMLYRQKQHFDKAYDYYSRALAYVDTPGDSIGLLNNRGNVYLDMKNYPLAEQDFRRSVDLSRSMGDTVRWARALNNLGVLQLEQQNKAGIASIGYALQLRQQVNDLEGMYSGNRHLALFALSEKDTATALHYTTKTLEIARRLNSASYTLESLSLLMNLNNDPLVSQYKALTDSINNAKQEEQNRYAALRFDVEKEILNTQKAELQLEKERSQSIMIQIIGLLLLLLLVLAIVLILIRIKHIRQREVHKTESRISKKVHDELANEVYQLMVKMQVEKNRDEEVLDDLEQIYNKSRDISKEYQALDTQTPFDEILTDLLLSYQSNSVKIIKRATTSIDWSKVSPEKKNAIFRVVQELMTNMKKHSKATLVAITLGQHHKKITLTYSDNGVGTMLKKQNGLQNAENRIFTLNGSITFESEPGKGFKAKIIV